MTEYQELLEEYADFSYSHRVSCFTELEWADVPAAERYCKKYWLPKKEYEAIWKPIQDRIFINQDKGLPSQVFAPNYQMLAIFGGCLFTESDFVQLQKCVRAIGDQYIIIVQNHQVQVSFPAPPLRMKFPSEISWKELMSGNFISAILIDFDDYEYFVFSESALWGKYLSNSFKHSVDLIGFKKEYASLFRRVFRLSPTEKEEVYAWLPESYKKYIL